MMADNSKTSGCAKPVKLIYSKEQILANFKPRKKEEMAYCLI